MRKLGLIGGTGPESTIEYYRSIVYGVQEKAGFLPNLTIESLSVFSVLRFCELGDLNGLKEYLLKVVQALLGAGADFAALTGITPHVVFPALQDESPIPLVSMVEASCDYVSSKGFPRVALLGTGPTMKGRFFQDAFARKGVEAVTPQGTEQQYIASKIEKELEYGIVRPETQMAFCDIVKRVAS